MVDYGVEGLLDDKIQDGRRLKVKNSYYTHYIDYYGVKCYVVRVKEFIKLLNLGVERQNETKIQNIRHFKFQNFLIYPSRVMILEPKRTFSQGIQ